MTITSLSDLSQNILLRRQSASLRVAFIQATNQVATGRVDDLTLELRGQFGPLAGVERALALTASFLNSNGEEALEVDARQSVFEGVRSQANQLFGQFMTANEEVDTAGVRAAGKASEMAFATAVNKFNSQAGGRTLFSGTDVNLPALADAETMLVDIENEIALAGATTAADLIAVVDDWFDTGGRFETVGYIGGPQATTGRALSETETTPPAITADDARIREALSAFVLGGLIGRGALEDYVGERGILARTTGERMLVAENTMVEVQAEMGIVQNQIERAGVEVLAEREALETSRTEIVGVDSFEAAVDLQAIELQVRQLYTVTAQLADLSLVSYLR